MKNKISIFTTMLLLSVCVLFFSCKKEDVTTKSTELAIGDGKGYSWVKISSDGAVLAIGFTLNDAALIKLPEGDPMTGNSTSYRLSFPADATKTPFNHLDIGWQAHGHEPPGIYDVPHFDFHFYTVSPATHDAIPPYQVDKTGFEKDPPAGSIPAGYIKNPGGVPGMGCHWNDSKATEFAGKPFTETFIFGSYNSQVTFWESMITQEVLNSNPNISRTIPQPTTYPIKGLYYPTTMTVKRVGTDIVFTMDGMVMR